MKNNFSVYLPYSHALSLQEEKGVSLPEVLMLLRSLGITGIDLDTEGADSAAIREAGLSVGAVYAFFDAATASPTDVTALAERTGAATVVLLPFSKRDAAALPPALSSLATAAHAKGITLAVENAASSLSAVATPSDVTALFREDGPLTLSFHTAQYFLRDVNTVAFFREVAPRVSRIVLADLLPDEQDYGDVPLAVDGDVYYYPAPLGTGVFPMKTLRHLLRENTVTPPLSLSLYGVKDMESALLHSLEFLQDG